MIIRTTHDKNNPYYIKSRDCVSNKSMSWKAKGIHDYLMSKPDGWEISIENLINASTDGESATRSGVKELIDAGFMIRVRVTDKLGKVTGWVLNAYESPTSNPDCGFPDVGFPDVGFPDVDNQGQVINETTVTKEKKKLVLSSKAEPLQTATATAPASVTVTEEAGVTGDAIPSTPVPLAPPPTEQQRKFQLLCNIVGWDSSVIGEKEKGKVAQTLGILAKAGYTEEHLKQFFEKVWSKDWRWQNHKSYPNLSQVRAEIGKLKQSIQIAPVRTDAKSSGPVVPYYQREEKKGYYSQ